MGRTKDGALRVDSGSGGWLSVVSVLLDYGGASVVRYEVETAGALIRAYGRIWRRSGVVLLPAVRQYAERESSDARALSLPTYVPVRKIESGEHGGSLRIALTVVWVPPVVGSLGMALGQ